MDRILHIFALDPFSAANSPSVSRSQPLSAKTSLQVRVINADFAVIFAVFKAPVGAEAADCGAS